MEPHHLVFDAVWALCCGYAAVRGGPPERLAAATFLLAAPLSAVLASHPGRVYRAPEVAIGLVDLGVLAVLLALALASARFWPMAMASMQGVEVLGHLARLLASDLIPDAYYALIAFWAFPMLALLVLATWRHRRRLARHGIDHAWTAELPPRYRQGYSIHAL